MNSKLIWTDQVPERDGAKCPIYDISISPDGSRVIIAAGNRVLLYDGNNGDLIESLRGHKDTVNSVDFSGDGTRFASGGSDNVVVIWKSSGQGLLRYNHTAPIQRVKYNPSSLQLASCSDIDFGLWNPEQKQVSKEKVGSKILSATWSPDGLTLAIGMQSGVISLRNQQGEETYRIERRAPVFCMVFVPGVGGAVSKGGASPTSGGFIDGDVLAVGCWDKTLSMYRLQGTSHRLVGERSLRYYPCSLALAGANGSKSNNLIIAGSNRKVMLYSRDGMRLAEIAKKSSWVWGIGCSQTNSTVANFLPDFDRVVLGTDAGGIDTIQLLFESVHSLYRDRYAYRENLTEIIVHNLVSDKKVRIKCKDLIKNISMYKNKLAVQLTDRVCIYESSAEEALDMHFRLRKERISIGTPNQDKTGKESQQGDDKATAMVVTSNNLLFCRSTILEIYGLDGQRLRVWRLDSTVTYMKVVGGPEGREGILLGLANGSVVKVFVNNPFPVELYKASTPPCNVPSSNTNSATENNTALGLLPTSCIDMSLYRTFLAVVNSQNELIVVDVKTQEIIFSRACVTSVCFNSEVNNMFCYTKTSSLSCSDSSMYVVSGIGLRKVAEAVSTSIGSNKPATALAGPAHLQYATPLEQLQHIPGPAIGFQAQKIYSLHRGVILGVDVPHSENVRRAIEIGDIKSAYSVACLGATEADWKLLAVSALRGNSLEIAKNCFARLKDTKYLSLIESIEKGDIHSSVSVGDNIVKAVSSLGASGQKSTGRVRGVDLVPVVSGVGVPSNPQILDPSWQAELLAYEGRHQEAAKTFSRAGKINEAIQLLVNLRRWEDAKLFSQNAGQSDHGDLTMQQAKWLQEINDWKGAAELYASMGRHMQAAKIISESGETGWQVAMIEVVRTCPVEEKETLLFCGEIFNKENEDAFTKETYMKTGNVSLLMNLYAKRQMWTEAAKLADENAGKFDVLVFLPYAEFLVSQDLYEDAMVAYKKAGRSDLAKKVLEELTFNAVNEARFKDAAYYYWLLSKEGDDGQNIEDLSEEAIPLVQQQAIYGQKADLYFAYSNVHAFVTDPFTSFQPEMLFQVSRYILNSLGNSESIPFGISKAATLYTLARQAMPLGAFKLARHVYDRLSMLQTLQLTLSKSKKQDEIELDMLVVQAKPVRDDPDILPVCYRCSSTNPLLNPFTNKFAKGDVCTNCGHPFVRSFVNFDILPLVEFVPDFRISDDDAIELIRQAGGSRAGEGVEKSGWKEGKEGESDMMTLDDDEDNPPHGGYDGYTGSSFRGGEEQDLFTRCVNNALENQRNSYMPATLDAATLVSLKRSEVFVCRPTSKIRRATFYRNMLPEIPIAMSQPCLRFFHLEDFESAYLSSKNCPYSRMKSVGEYGPL